MEVKLAADHTDGALSLLALTLVPGAGAGFHRHTRELEIVFVVAGRLRVEGDDEVLELNRGARDSSSVRRGALIARGYRQLSAPAKAMCSPSR